MYLAVFELIIVLFPSIQCLKELLFL